MPQIPEVFAQLEQAKIDLRTDETIAALLKGRKYHHVTVEHIVAEYNERLIDPLSHTGSMQARVRRQFQEVVRRAPTGFRDFKPSSALRAQVQELVRRAADARKEKLEKREQRGLATQLMRLIEEILRRRA